MRGEWDEVGVPVVGYYPVLTMATGKILPQPGAPGLSDDNATMLNSDLAKMSLSLSNSVFLKRR